jgi:hypothetical protein
MIKDDGRQLQVLLTDYVATRDDGRGFWNLVAALIAVGIAILAGAGALASQPTCGRSAPVTRGQKAAALHCVPTGAWVVFPLLPLGISALVVQQVAIHQIRAEYERKLEIEIASTAAAEFHTAESGLPVPSLSRLLQPMFDPPSRTVVFAPMVLLNYSLFLLIATVDLGSVSLAFHELKSHEHARILMWILSGACLAVQLATGWVIRRGPRDIWKPSVAAVRRSLPAP